MVALTDMDPTAITTMVTTVGFPIVAAWLLWVFTRNRIEASEKAAEAREAATLAAAEKREAASQVREEKLGERIDHLQDDIRTDLAAIIGKNAEAMDKVTDVMGDAKEVMAYCSGTLKACTVAMQDMTDTQKRMSDKEAKT